MNVVLSSRLNLTNSAQLSALCKALHRETLTDANVVFIGDAASNSDGNLPEWINGEFDKFNAAGAKITPCLLSKDDWATNKQKILDADILFFEGGSTPKLLQAIKNTELMTLVNSGILDQKVWFGISAGGCVLSRECYSSCEKWFMENPGEQPTNGLTAGNFYFIPHYKSPDFAPNTEENLPYVQAKLAGREVVIGTDNCVVTGTLQNSLFTPIELYDAFKLA